MELYPHQQEAVNLLSSGKVLYGEVGVGKTATALGYYVQKQSPKDIYVITTAKKRDSLDWQGDAAKFGISPSGTPSLHGTLTVDSWNNVVQYLEVRGAFFVFDEQRVVGSGAWVKSFLRIARSNDWILLSATPGDTWMDYIPLFVANGFYKNASEFKQRHVIYAPFVKFPRVLRYADEDRLERLRNEVLVEMPYQKHTERHINYLPVGYDKALWRKAVIERWNPYTDEPIQDVSELFRVMRRISNTDPSRLEMVRTLMKTHPRLIIFYNFNYELDILRQLGDEVECTEYNGKKKDEISKSDKWVHLVQYSAGAEGWNCIETDAMVLYSLTYSYKSWWQAQGRIDRMNTPFTDLYYYVLANHSKIDAAVLASLKAKKSFNESRYAKKFQNWG